jgi:AcrR family transcriptional regulator
LARPRQRNAELRERVIETAMTVLAADGVEGFTTRRVASSAGTSTPAVYELFGDKGGLVREVFFQGFELLGAHLASVPESGEPRADLVAAVQALRRFVRANPVLSQVMFSRAFADFDPGPDEVKAGAGVRECIVGRARRCVDGGVLSGDPVDIAHVVLALAQGLAAQEAAGWLGTSKASIDRRWALGIDSVLAGASSSSTGRWPSSTR